MSKTRIAINGAAGRMGKRLVALGAADAELEIAAALEFAQHPEIGTDAGLVAGIGEIGVPISAALDANVDAAIDFSLPAGAEAITRMCIDGAIPLVMATTGLTDEQKKLITAAAEKVAVVWAPNMSMAVNLTMKLAATAAEILKDNPNGADVEIIERHHRFKKDAPSGTALHFGKIIADIMGQGKHTHGREGLVGERPRDEIGYHALRVGDNPGEHTIVFGMLGETIELTVRATNRDCYALGALAAAKFAAKQTSGLYGMDDVLGL
ncbi:MAG: 4-hydroxy-tetrahydrodipicolinate reductase [Planctomycetes bacterium]|nr:4-hydroxy-tetrahydrodipicolinate reductase [Planctomycetota bacterium]MBL7040851.1 4-hydroxy-tetrahydrodipicolinate reductase [Pirellulaceae bacterium]